MTIDRIHDRSERSPPADADVPAPRTGIRRLLTATTAGCMLLLRGDTVQRRAERAAAIVCPPAADVQRLQSEDIESEATSGSLLDRVLHVEIDASDGVRRIPVRIMRDEHEMILRVDNDDFRGTGSVPGFGTVRELITDVSGEGELIRFDSDGMGYATMSRARFASIIDTLADAPADTDTIEVPVSVTYAPPPNPSVRMGYAFLRSLGHLTSDGRYTRMVTFKRAHAVQIAQHQR